jgi:hypothetical protein
MLYFSLSRRALRMLACFALAMTTGCSLGMGAVGSRHEMPKVRGGSYTMAAGWYPTKVGPLWTTYEYRESSTMVTPRWTDPGGWGLGFGLKYGIAAPRIPTVETSTDTAWDIYGVLHAKPWTFAVGWGVEHGGLPDLEGFDVNVDFSTYFVEVGRHLYFLPTPLGLDFVAVLGLGSGKLDSPMHAESDRVLTYRPGLRMLKTLRTTDASSIVLVIEGRYTYSRELTFNEGTFNYASPTLLAEIAIRI